MIFRWKEKSKCHWLEASNISCYLKTKYCSWVLYIIKTQGKCTPWPMYLFFINFLVCYIFCWSWKLVTPLSPQFLNTAATRMLTCCAPIALLKPGMEACPGLCKGKCSTKCSSLSHKRVSEKDMVIQQAWASNGLSQVGDLTARYLISEKVLSYFLLSHDWPPVWRTVEFGCVWAHHTRDRETQRCGHPLSMFLKGGSCPWATVGKVILKLFQDTSVCVKTTLSPSRTLRVKFPVN